MKNNSISEQIEYLAESTGAPADFVERIRTLFSNRGICLDGDSAPYASALEQAFKKEHSIRRSAQQTREQLERLQSQLTQFNETCRKQLERLQELHRALAQRAVRAADGSRTHDPTKPRRVQVLEITDDGAVRVKRTRTIMIPGPKDPQ